MKRIAIALVLVLGLAGCLSDQAVTETSTSVTAEPGGHAVVNVSVSADVSRPHLCYTADGDGPFDALVYADAEEYAAYADGEPSNPIAALSSISANKSDIEPDVDLGGQVEPRTHHIVIDNSDYDAIEPLESGSPSPAADGPVTVEVTAAVREESC